MTSENDKLTRNSNCAFWIAQNGTFSFGWWENRLKKCHEVTPSLFRPGLGPRGAKPHDLFDILAKVSRRQPLTNYCYTIRPDSPLLAGSASGTGQEPARPGTGQGQARAEGQARAAGQARDRLGPGTGPGEARDRPGTGQGQAKDRPGTGHGQASDRPGTGQGQAMLGDRPGTSPGQA